jgi:hypothetical protein
MLLNLKPFYLKVEKFENLILLISSIPFPFILLFFFYFLSAIFSAFLLFFLSDYFLYFSLSISFS